MSDTALWQSPLEGLLTPGSSSEAPVDVSVQERPQMLQLQLIARRDGTEQLARAVAKLLGRKTPLAPLEGASRNGVFIAATGPFEYWATAETGTARKALGTHSAAIKNAASIFDQSAGRTVIRISGPRAPDLLAKGTSLDLHETAFPAQGAAPASIAHMPAVLIRRQRPTCYDVSLSLSYAASFADWLKEAMEAFDHRILAPRE